MEFPFRTVSGAELAALLASACAQTANSSASSHPPLFLLDCRHASLHARSHVRGALSAPSFDALSDRAFVMARLPRPQRADALKSFTLEACALPATTLAAVRVVMAGQSGSGSSGSAPGAADSAEGLLATATSAGADCCRVCVYDSGSMKVENASAALPLLFALHAAGVANIGFLSGLV